MSHKTATIAEIFSAKTLALSDLKSALKLAQVEIRRLKAQRKAVPNGYIPELNVLRPRVRVVHIAYSLLRGRSYGEIESSARVDTQPSALQIMRIIQRVQTRAAITAPASLSHALPAEYRLWSPQSQISDSSAGLEQAERTTAEAKKQSEHVPCAASRQKKAMYVLVRSSLSPTHQAVQAGHALAAYLQSVRSCEWMNGTLVYLEADDQELNAQHQRLIELGIEAVPYVDPDIDSNVTALACFSDSTLFRRFRLLSA